MLLLQTALAAGLSWFVAVHLLGHGAPLFAPVAAIVSVDATLGQRLRRAIELIVGASVGVGVGALLISAIGTGAWQIAVVVALAASVAVLLNGRAVINVQAAVSAVLVATSYAPGDISGIDRLFDGLMEPRSASSSTLCSRGARRWAPPPPLPEPALEMGRRKGERRRVRP